MIVREVLNFKQTKHSKNKKFDSNERAELPTGSEVFCKESRKGRTWKLFLNDGEYKEVIKEHGNTLGIYFYSENYIHLNYNVRFAPILKTLVRYYRKQGISW